jgi:hypothetical protein
MDEDTPVDLDVLANDRDADGERLTLATFTAPAHGVLTRAADGGLRYQPAADWFGADGFTYTVTDPGGLEATGAVALSVRPANDPPVAPDQVIVLNRNTQRDVFYQASDPDGSELTFAIVDGPRNGELWAYPDIATYYPAKGFAGDDAFTYTASDGVLTSRLARVSFQVLAANNPPVCEPPEFATRVDRPVTLVFEATDADEDAVRFEIVTPPARGALTPAGTNFVYTPEPGFVGMDELAFRATDGTDFSATIRAVLTVTDRNTAPVAKAATVEVKFNTPTRFVLPATDGEGDPLSYVILTNPVAGELSGVGPEMTYTPAPQYVGPDRFTFRARDAEFESEPATVTLQVVPRNRMPVASHQTLVLRADEPTALTFDLRDPDGDPLRIAILKGPRLGRLAGLGTNFVYTPRTGRPGVDRFTYKAWDGLTYSEIRTVTLQLEPPPPPRFERIDLQPDGGVRLRLKVEPGASLQLERSSNLVTWQALERLTATTNTIDVVDSPASAAGPAFYRAWRE